MEFHSKQAIYLQIADYVCENILTRKWEANARIPSVRELAVSAEVNPNTVMRTFNYLEEQDIIFKQRGIGYFIAENAYENVLRLKREVFFAEELPRIFKTMEFLSLDVSTLLTLHAEYKSNKKT